jgi:hypothetical protein
MIVQRAKGIRDIQAMMSRMQMLIKEFIDMHQSMNPIFPSIQEENRKNLSQNGQQKPVHQLCGSQIG